MENEEKIIKEWKMFCDEAVILDNAFKVILSDRDEKMILDYWLNKMKLKEAHDLSAIIEWVKKQRKETNGIEDLEGEKINEKNIAELVKRACNLRENLVIDDFVAHLTSLQKDL